MNLVLITSVIYTSTNKLSYTPHRSVYTPEQRFEQTKKTIDSVRSYIPNSKILFVECSMITDMMKQYFEETTDYFINLYENKKILDASTSNSKSLGEGMMTIGAIEYIIKNDIIFDNLYKISGRYHINNNFNWNEFDNNNIVAKSINNDINNIATVLYKIPNRHITNLYNFLCNSINQMMECIGYEVLFSQFINRYILDVKFIEYIGISGYLSVYNLLCNA